MNAYVYSDAPSATTAASMIDSAKGYPKPGVDVGAGIHVASAKSMTVRYADVVKHPTNAQWMVLSDAVTDSALVGKGQPAPVALDSTWDPPKVQGT